MARYIDAEAMIKRLEKWNTSDDNDKALYNFALNRIVEQPIVDVVEVVRCKDCKYYSKNFFDTESVCQHWKTWYQTNGNDYCSYGKKVE